MPIKYTQADLQRALEDACIAKIDFNDNNGSQKFWDDYMRKRDFYFKIKEALENEN